MSRVGTYFDIFWYILIYFDIFCSCIVWDLPRCFFSTERTLNHLPGSRVSPTFQWNWSSNFQRKRLQRRNPTWVWWSWKICLLWMATPVRGWEQTDLDPFCDRKWGKEFQTAKRTIWCARYLVLIKCSLDAHQQSKKSVKFDSISSTCLKHYFLFFAGPGGYLGRCLICISGFLNCAISWFQTFFFDIMVPKQLRFWCFYIDVSRLAFFYGNFFGRMMWGIWPLV